MVILFLIIFSWKSQNVILVVCIKFRSILINPAIIGIFHFLRESLYDHHAVCVFPTISNLKQTNKQIFIKFGMDNMPS
jgi:hypothetical protein